jgi:hypothetical protein
MSYSQNLWKLGREIEAFNQVNREVIGDFKLTTKLKQFGSII